MPVGYTSKTMASTGRWNSLRDLASPGYNSFHQVCHAHPAGFTSALLLSICAHAVVNNLRAETAQSQ